MTEEERLDQARARTAHWRRWGPYVSERQWGTVREDYSADGEAWGYFPFEQARSRAYRWGEDGIAGICDNHQRLCLALALWNGRDPFLKERLFGVSGKQGNHGEDVKECYFYLDNTPTHSYMKILYRYPHEAFPYERLLEENRGRSREEPEFELLDTGLFSEDRFFDVFVEYAKAGPEDLLVRIEAVNRGPEERTLHVLPTLWFRNTWTWNGREGKPLLEEAGGVVPHVRIVHASHPTLGNRWLFCKGARDLLFTENETNVRRLYGAENSGPWVKDGINDYLVEGVTNAVNPQHRGTKCSAWYEVRLPPGRSRTLRLRLTDVPGRPDPFGPEFEAIMAARQQEADAFYRRVCPFPLRDDLRKVQRSAFAGLLWAKQFYHYVVEEWLVGDSDTPRPPASRRQGRNREWVHFYTDDILSMPDKWEYPWFAAWDLAFHAIPFAMIDPDFAKRQLDLLTREWYMHPNGQLPAYEWDLGNTNPPVHAWAAWRVYKIEKKVYGRADRSFLERVFQKLLLNFTWWVNRKDADGRNVFQGGFLGLDNIGVFDRNSEIPDGGHLEQADGTSWMAMYCLNMLAVAFELAGENPIYEDIASKFFEHFLYIAKAVHLVGGADAGLWDEQDGFYYDVLHLSGGRYHSLKVRSLVGLIPLLAVETIEPDLLGRLQGFRRRLEWFVANRPDLKKTVACMETPGVGGRRLLSIVNGDRLRRILARLLDEEEFLSPYGIRSLSRAHAEQPYVFECGGRQNRVGYEPGESGSFMFGGNSNWRGPVWFPLNFLIIEALQKFHHYFGSDFRVECPTGSGKKMNLWELARDISHRLIRLFLVGGDGHRPVDGDREEFQENSLWRPHILFHEYFHGDTGQGLGASHQTGWTALVAKLVQQSAEYGVRCPQTESRPEPSKNGRDGAADRFDEKEVHEP